MRLATFDIDPKLGEALAGVDGIEPIACDSPAAEVSIAGALEATERLLADSAADRGLIGGSGEWALAAALACAKAVVPYAYVHLAASDSARCAAHARRLADTVIAEADPAAAVQAWLAASGGP